MANSCTNSGVALGQSASGSAGGAASAASAEGLPPAPAIPVPAWMRGGASFDFAANRFEPGCGVLPYRPTGCLRADAESRRASYYQLMSGIACEYGIPVGLFDAMIIRESRYRTDALSPKNRSEEHTSELQSLMRSSYAVFCLKKKKTNTTIDIMISITNT